LLPASLSPCSAAPPALPSLPTRRSSDLNLALVGLPGVVFTPRAGLGLPAIAFGHGWLQPPARYRRLLHHLASWGIVAAAPATQRGLLPSPRLMAADLLTTLDVVSTIRLGPDGIS